MPDPDFTSGDQLQRYNLEVPLESQEQAKSAIAALEAQDLKVEITLDTDADRRAALRVDMRDELEATILGPGNVGPHTKAQTRGIAKWGSVSVLVGAFVMFLIGLVVWRSVTGLILMPIIGAVAGLVFGFVAGGFAEPRRLREGYADSEKGPVLGIHSSSTEELDRAVEILRGKGIHRVDPVDAAGRPVGLPTKDTRPLRGDTPT